MKCLRCGCDNEADSRFCSKCGMRLVPPKGPVPVGEGSNDPRMEAVQGKRLTQTEKIVIAALAGFALIIIVVFGVKSMGRESSRPVQKPPVVTAGSEQVGPVLSGSEAVEAVSAGNKEKREKKKTHENQDSFEKLNAVKDVEKAAKDVAEGKSSQTLFLVKADSKDIKTNVTKDNLKAFAEANGLEKKKGQSDPAYVDSGNASCAIGYTEKTGYYFMVSGQSEDDAIKFMQECGSMFFTGDAKKAYNAAVKALAKEPASERYEMAADFVIGEKWMVEMDVSAKSPDGLNHSYAISIRDVESDQKKGN